MNGIYDLGGADGFGRIEVEKDEPVFHEDWHVLGYSLGMLGPITFDEARHAIERIEPDLYLAASYYERIVIGIASLFVEKGILTREELEEKAGGRFPLALPVAPGSGRLPDPGAPKLAPGDRVLVRDEHPPGHIRAPRYVRGRCGVVVHVTPSPFQYPDAQAHGLPHDHEPTCHVRFEARELWGDAAEENCSVVVDLWQSYLVKESAL
jgi:nitrile hydratase beta subunit